MLLIHDFLSHLLKKLYLWMKVTHCWLLRKWPNIEILVYWQWESSRRFNLDCWLGAKTCLFPLLFFLYACLFYNSIQNPLFYLLTFETWGKSLNCMPGVWIYRVNCKFKIFGSVDWWHFLRCPFLFCFFSVKLSNKTVLSWVKFLKWRVQIIYFYFLMLFESLFWWSSCWTSNNFP